MHACIHAWNTQTLLTRNLFCLQSMYITIYLTHTYSNKSIHTDALTRQRASSLEALEKDWTSSGLLGCSQNAEAIVAVQVCVFVGICLSVCARACIYIYIYIYAFWLVSSVHVPYVHEMNDRDRDRDENPSS